MKEKISIFEAAGCTLTGVALSLEEVQLLLDFGDRGFAVLCAKDDGEGNDFIDEPEEFDPWNFESEFLIETGIVTVEEWKEMLKSKREYQDARMEEWERKELARLKAKYEGK